MEDPPGGCGSNVAASAEAADGAGEGTAVSQLQELVQSCTSFSPHTKILNWTFNQRIESAVLQFQAVVSLMFNSIPHFFTGGWQSSKRKAQRDAAERVKHYLSGSLDAGQAAKDPDWDQPPSTSTGVVTLAGGRHRAAIDPEHLTREVLEELSAACQRRGPRGDAAEGSARCAVEWRVSERRAPGAPDDCVSSATAAAGARGAGGGVPDPAVERLATVAFVMHGVPHHFAGTWCAGGHAQAKADAAERVLWYFGHLDSGFATSERAADSAAALEVPPHFPSLSCGRVSQPLARADGPGDCTAVQLFGAQDAEGDSPAAGFTVEDKTILMRVQNMLQRSFATQTTPGQRVWEWSYEADDADPQLFCAHVTVPLWGEEFQGGWCKGKKAAQRSACMVVKQRLDGLPDSAAEA